METKGIIFDYGGTLDTNGTHWAEVLWRAYQKEGIAISRDMFREAYVHAERELEAEPVILPGDTFLDVLRKKTDIETRYLSGKGYWRVDELTRRPDAEHIALDCLAVVREGIARSKTVLRLLTDKYRLALVSNFYGNLRTVLSDFGIDCFTTVIESAEVGVRKPDTAIFRVAFRRMGLSAAEVTVVGDSLKNDIRPAKALGCKTVWLKGIGWDGAQADAPEADYIISDIEELIRLQNDSCL